MADHEQDEPERRDGRWGIQPILQQLRLVGERPAVRTAPSSSRVPSTTTLVQVTDVALEVTSNHVWDRDVLLGHRSHQRRRTYR